jgi:hypothetical protein
MPGWTRLDAPVTGTDADPGAVSGAAFQAGAALALLDGRVRAGVPFAGAWRRRLALKAAAASARIARRGEDEATLRDAFLLRHGRDDPGPAGRMLVAWRESGIGGNRSASAAGFWRRRAIAERSALRRFWRQNSVASAAPVCL